MKRHRFLSRKKARQERALNNLIERIQKDENPAPETAHKRRAERARLSFLLFGAGNTTVSENAHG